MKCLEEWNAIGVFTQAPAFVSNPVPVETNGDTSRRKIEGRPRGMKRIGLHHGTRIRRNSFRAFTGSRTESSLSALSDPKVGFRTAIGRDMAAIAMERHCRRLER